MSSRRSGLIEGAWLSRKLAHRCEAALRLPWRKMLLYSLCRSFTLAVGATAGGHAWCCATPLSCCARQLSAKQLSIVLSREGKTRTFPSWGRNSAKDPGPLTVNVGEQVHDLATTYSTPMRSAEASPGS